MSSAPAKTMRKAVGSKIFPENSSKSATFSSTGKNRQKIAARRQKIAARLAAPAKARRKRGWKPLNEQQASSWHGLCRSEEHTSELQSLMRISYAVFCLKKKKKQPTLR